MAIYTVHEPPAGGRDAWSHADRFLFVRDGFYIWAFLLTPLWMLWRKLWLPLVLYLVIASALSWGLHALGVSNVAIAITDTLVSLLIGLEASSLWRWSLRRRGWRNVGIVNANSIDEAERRFFDSWTGTPDRAVAAAPGGSGPQVPAASYRDVIGLFPRPGARA